MFYKPEYKDGFSVESVLADDWEIQEEIITVTRSQVEKALRDYGGYSLQYFDSHQQLVNQFCKALGFSEK